jgi:PucR C-terminal helix-turn-helix domain/GGDEF-like domain
MEPEERVRDVEYLQSLTTAVHAGVQYGVEVLAVGEERAADIPLPAIAQARLAARHRIPLETVLHRYMAADKKLATFVLEEAAGVDPSDVLAAMTAQGTAFQRLVAVVTEEYVREAGARPASHEARRVERARRLLAGELVDPGILDYELDGHHLGLVASSVGARPLIRKLAGELGCRSLILAPSSNELWAWLGGTREPVDPAAVRARLAAGGDPVLPIGVGEPKSDSKGWRLTHAQARRALWVAEAKSAPVVDYEEAALLSTVARDPTLTTSLHEKYLLPLSAGPDGGQVLRATLRTYFKAERNSSAAAAALGVTRQTVTSRLKLVEQRIGQPLGDCDVALIAALSLEELGHVPGPPHSLP